MRRESWPHYLPPVFHYFFARFWGQIFQNPRNRWKYLRGWFAETENFWTEKKRENTIKIRDFKTVLRWEWAKGAKQKLDKNKKGKFVPKSPARKRPRIVALSARRLFRIFGASRKKRPGKSRNHYKNSGFRRNFGHCFKGRFRDRGLRREFGPGTRGIWARKTPWFTQDKFPWITPLKMLGSAAGSIWGNQISTLRWPNSLPEAYIYIYIYVNVCWRVSFSTKFWAFKS